MNIRACAAALTLAVAATLITPAASAAAADPAACRLWADPPEHDPVDNVVTARGGWGGCDTSRTVTVKLVKYNRFWFDTELAGVRATGREVSLAAVFNCTGIGYLTVYTRAEVSGRTVESRNVGVNACG